LERERERENFCIHILLQTKAIVKTWCPMGCVGEYGHKYQLDVLESASEYLTEWRLSRSKASELGTINTASPDINNSRDFLPSEASKEPEFSKVWQFASVRSNTASVSCPP
jgi:exonuclease III